MPLFGSHLSIAGGFYKAVDSAAALQMDSVQIFTGSPQIWSVAPVPVPAKSKPPVGVSAWQGKAIAAEDSAKFKAHLAEKKILQPIAHASYLINLATPNDDLRAKSTAAMASELRRASQLGIAYVVVHPGAHTTATEAEGIDFVSAALNEIDELTKDIDTICLLENTAGQGTCLGWKFDQLAQMIAGTKRPERVGVCIDTCHAFAAGYNITTQSGYAAMIAELDHTVGLDKVRAMHLNDSKKGCGSRVDRHEHIGLGAIGEEAFGWLVRDERFASMPMYLETPKEDKDGVPWDTINLNLLKALQAGKPASKFVLAAEVAAPKKPTKKSSTKAATKKPAVTKPAVKKSDAKKKKS